MSPRHVVLVLIVFFVVTEAPVSLSGDTLCSPSPISVCTAEDIAAIPVETISNKLWSATVTPAGYSDLTIRGAAPYPRVDPRTPTGPAPLHEWLSGEFAFAISYNGMTPMWGEKCMRFPDWGTGNNFSIIQPVQFIGDTDLDGLDEANSIIGNANLQIKTTYDMQVLVDGVAMGRGALGGAAYQLSSPYALMYRYDIQNVSASPLTDVSFYQFSAMHPANTETATIDIVYDDSMHSFGDFTGFRYDITATATNSGLTDGFPTGSTFIDHVGFSSSVAPNAHGLGIYPGHNPGDPGLPAMPPYKPLQGEHCDVENQALANETILLQEEAAGSMRFDLGTLAPSETKTVEILFTAHSSNWGFPCDACLRVVDDTAPELEIALEKGMCVVAQPSGPYDVIMGSLSDLAISPGCNPAFDCSVIINNECIAKSHAFDRIDITQHAHKLDGLYFLLRPSGTFTTWGDGLGTIGSLPLRRFFFTYQGAGGVDVCDTVP